MRVLKPYFGNPALARILPFVIFLALTLGQGQFGPASVDWFYLAKTLVGAWLIWEMYPFVSEMRWNVSWEALIVGISICVVWVALDPYYPHFFKSAGMGNPLAIFGNSPMARLFIAVHVLGMTFIVPPLEEVFYRSFCYRYLARQDFLSVPMSRFLPFPFFATAIVFGMAHAEWLAGILCGMAYQWLVLRKNRLGDAMTAHAITNFLLGVWIVWRGAWNFW